MLTEINQLKIFRKRIPQHHLRRMRHQHLTAMCRRHQPRCPIQRRPEIVTVPSLGLTGMKPDPNPQPFHTVPPLVGEPSLACNSRRSRIASSPEDRMHAITRRLNHPAADRLDYLPQDLVMASQRGLHRLGVLLPQTRRSLEIGEQERHRPARQLGHPTPPVGAHSQSAANRSRQPHETARTSAPLQAPRRAQNPHPPGHGRPRLPHIPLQGRRDTPYACAAVATRLTASVRPYPWQRAGSPISCSYLRTGGAPPGRG